MQSLHLALNAHPAFAQQFSDIELSRYIQQPCHSIPMEDNIDEGGLLMLNTSYISFKLYSRKQEGSQLGLYNSASQIFALSICPRESWIAVGTSSSKSNYERASHQERRSGKVAETFSMAPKQDKVFCSSLRIRHPELETA
ncbi:hypothetical protein PROFUN_15652 [Planoprotostelium fungivorum]|uniref:Uncharacterized protein n=1 Tax=Planoprotostelium fungivorum TaxID=1890364 RepID=A0A2P6MV41_9EUKA|nr:hypothetical protein PROFUN_15652 [Planoprotostelium fungivorum]